jgi:hypothetical protein
VTYVVTADYHTLLNAASIASFDADRGPFYDLSVSGWMYAYRVVFSTAFFLVLVACVYCYARDLAANGLHFRRSAQIALCIGLCCLGRGLKVSMQEQQTYYMDTPPSLSYQIGESLLFWLPLVFGTLAYTLTAFGWATVVSSLRSNTILLRLRLPIVGFFVLVLVVVIALAIAGGYLGFTNLTTFSVLIIVVGVFEAVTFLYYGTRVLRLMSSISKELRTDRNRLELSVSSAV